MTRLKLLKNPRAITMLLLALTLGLAVVAIVTAVSLQRRQNVNPTPSQAGECNCPEQSSINTSKANYAAWKTANPGKTDANWEREIREAEARCSQWKAANCTSDTTPLQKCNEFTDWTNAHDPKTCTTGQAKNCGLYSKTCNGTSAGDQASAQVKCSACYTPSSGQPAPTPPDAFPPAPETEGWLTGYNCRYRTGGGECARAEFKNCTPDKGEMCICSGGDKQGPDGWTYANGGPKPFTPGKCKSSCAPGEEGAGKTAPECGNAYRCPGTPAPGEPAPTPTLPPPPTCTESCVGTSWVMKCEGIITSTIPDWPSCKTTTCSPSSKCEGRDYVTRDCKGSETGRRREDPRCIPTTTLNPQCIQSYIDGVPGLTSRKLAPGQSVRITTTVLNPTSNSAGLAFFNLENKTTTTPSVPQGAQVSPLVNPTGYNTLANNQDGITGTATVGNDAPQVRTFEWTLHYDQLFNNQVDLKFGSKPINMLQMNAYAGGMTRGDANCVISLEKTSIPVTSTPTNTATASPSPSTAPAICTQLQVKNNRNNIVCDSNTNPTNCDLKQGDSITTTLTGTGASQYRVQSSWIGTQSSFSTSSTSTFTIPTTALPNNSISLTGYTSNGQATDSHTAPACAFTAQFSSIPVITKEIDLAGTTAVNETTDPVVVDSTSLVKYDITIKNNGTSGIMHNVIVVDSLTSYDANGALMTTPFGDIVAAENLTRTVGTKSDPTSAAPRVPSGNTYPQANNIKTVEWNKINNLYYGETYEASITVDVAAGQRTLRNNVCMYEDTYPTTPNGQFDYNDVNNNGKYDFGIDTPRDRLLGCDHVDVVTTPPTYTVSKLAIAETTTDAIQVAKPGDKFRYQVALKNTSASVLDLTTVTLTDTFDNAFLNMFEFVTLPTGANRASNVITWKGEADQSASTLAAGATATYTFTVQIKATFFEGNVNCAEAVGNTVKASSSGFTTPDYQVYITVSDNPLCAPTPLPPTEIPNTGLPTFGIAKFVGAGVMGLAVLFYVMAIRRKATPAFTGFANAMQSRNTTLNDKLSDIVSRLKNR
jgi:hypothetical protein